MLGDDNQAKPYLHVSECIDGMIYGYLNSFADVNTFNLSCRRACNVKKIATCVIKKMGLKDVKLKFTGGSRGWIGDVPQVRLNASKLRMLGWQAKYTSDGAVKKAAEELLRQI